MMTDDEKDLNFKVDPQFHQAFKLAATGACISMKDLLEDCFWFWINRLNDLDQRKRLRDLLTKKDNQERNG